MQRLIGVDDANSKTATSMCMRQRILVSSTTFYAASFIIETLAILRNFTGECLPKASLCFFTI